MFGKLSQRLTQLTFKNKRFFDLHEYQAKEVMRKFNVKVQTGEIATSAEQAYNVAKQLDPSGGLILKSQVHAGGRGKGHLTSGLKGGVKFCKNAEEVRDFTSQMIGYNLITHQTTKEGLKVQAVLIHEGVDIKREIYLAYILDRQSQKPALICSKYGGVEIEEVDHKDILVCPIEPKVGLTEDIIQKVIKELELTDMAAQAKEQLQNLYKMFGSLDLIQLEINPWAVDPSNTLYCIDGKLNVDDNAKFRQHDLVQMKDNSLGAEQIDEHEKLACDAGLNYVALDGNIGCMVNGAGLAMATMDIIKINGGEPANFLDVGGGASVEQISTAFKILNDHPKVQTLLVNIFGGILKCDRLAEGIIKAAQIVGLKKTLVVRLSGTNSEKGKEILNEYSANNSNFKILTADNLDDAASKAVSTLK